MQLTKYGSEVVVSTFVRVTQVRTMLLTKYGSEVVVSTFVRVTQVRTMLLTKYGSEVVVSTFVRVTQVRSSHSNTTLVKYGRKELFYLTTHSTH